MNIAPKAGERLSALVVDEDQETRELIKSFLASMDCWLFIVEAHNGQQAFMKSQKQVFDLIVTEQKLPKASGLEFLKNLKHAEKDSLKKTPVLLLSGHLTQDEVQKAREIGVKHVMAKPCEEKKFISKVVDILKKEKKDKIKALAGPQLKKKTS